MFPQRLLLFIAVKVPAHVFTLHRCKVTPQVSALYRFIAVKVSQQKQYATLYIGEEKVSHRQNTIRYRRVAKFHKRERKKQEKKRRKKTRRKKNDTLHKCRAFSTPGIQQYTEQNRSEQNKEPREQRRINQNFSVYIAIQLFRT